MWRDDVVRRDSTWIRRTKPREYTMQVKGYRGAVDAVAVLKNAEDRKSVAPNVERIRELLRS